MCIWLFFASTVQVVVAKTLEFSFSIWHTEDVNRETRKKLKGGTTAKQMQNTRILDLSRYHEWTRDCYKSQVLQNTLEWLQGRQITPELAKQGLEERHILVPRDWGEAIDQNVPHDTQDKSTSMLGQMTYLETKQWIDKWRKRIPDKVILDRLYDMWHEEEITGFDYIYTLQVMGVEIPKQFKDVAERIGRFYN